MPSGASPFPYGTNPWKEFPKQRISVGTRMIYKCIIIDNNNNTTTLPTGSYVPFPSDAVVTSTPVPNGFKGQITWTWQMEGTSGMIVGGSDWP